MFWRWNVGTFLNDVSLYEISGTPGLQINRPWWYIPVIMHHTICIGWSKMTGMYQCRDIGFLIHLGDQGSQKIHMGKHPGRPVTPPFWPLTCPKPFSLINSGWVQPLSCSHPQVKYNVSRIRNQFYQGGFSPIVFLLGQYEFPPTECVFHEEEEKIWNIQ